MTAQAGSKAVWPFPLRVLLWASLRGPHFFLSSLRGLLAVPVQISLQPVLPCRFACMRQGCPYPSFFPSTGLGMVVWCSTCKHALSVLHGEEGPFFSVRGRRSESPFSPAMIGVLFRASGKIPAPPSKHGDLPCRPEQRFFGVGGGGYGGGRGSFYKKRPFLPRPKRLPFPA